MSRRMITARDPAAHPEVWVGWDAPMQTYFAQVFGKPDAEGEDTMAFWTGGKLGEVTTVAALRDLLAPYADLPPATEVALLADRVVNDGLPGKQDDADRIALAYLRAAGGNHIAAAAALAKVKPARRPEPVASPAALIRAGLG